MQIELVSVEADQRRHILDLPIKIGSSSTSTPTSTLRLTGEGISRLHALIEYDEDTRGVYLIDLSSVHGTRVNGTKITKLQLASGDTLTFGTHSFKVILPAGFRARSNDEFSTVPPDGSPPIVGNGVVEPGWTGRSPSTFFCKTCKRSMICSKVRDQEHECDQPDGFECRLFARKAEYSAEKARSLSRYIIGWLKRRNGRELRPAFQAMTVGDHENLLAELEHILIHGGHPPNWTRLEDGFPDA